MTASPLAARHCAPCRKGTQPLADDRIVFFASEVPAWTVSRSPAQITRRFAFADFDTALAFVTQVAAIAGAEDHHPDIAFGWGYAAFTLTTHAIGGLSENDFIVAARIDDIGASSVSL